MQIMCSKAEGFIEKGKDMISAVDAMVAKILENIHEIEADDER